VVCTAGLRLTGETQSRANLGRGLAVLAEARQCPGQFIAGFPLQVGSRFGCQKLAKVIDRLVLRAEAAHGDRTVQ